MIERLFGRPLHYAWLIMIVTFVTLITTAGFRATPGVLIVPLHQEFGWSRGTIAIAISLGLLLYGLSAPFSAALMERFGVRRVMLIAPRGDQPQGASLTTVMTSPWQLDLLWGVVVGSATGSVSVPLAATVANRWFESRRGLVTGILTASNASGQMIFLPALAWLTTAYGWRWAALSVAVVAIGLVVPDRRDRRTRPAPRRSGSGRTARRGRSSPPRRQRIRSGLRSTVCCWVFARGRSGSSARPSSSAVSRPTA